MHYTRNIHLKHIKSYISAVGIVLRAIIDTLKELTRAPTLTDALLFQNYAQTILVLDEVCKEGIVEHLDKASILKAMALKLPAYGPDVVDRSISGIKSIMSQKYSSSTKTT